MVVLECNSWKINGQSRANNIELENTSSGIVLTATLGASLRLSSPPAMVQSLRFISSNTYCNSM